MHTHTQKQQQKNKQIIQLILCHLDVGGWRKEKGTRLIDFVYIQPQYIRLHGLVEELGGGDFFRVVLETF